VFGRRFIVIVSLFPSVEAPPPRIEMDYLGTFLYSNLRRVSSERTSDTATFPGRFSYRVSF